MGRRFNDILSAIMKIKTTNITYTTLEVHEQLTLKTNEDNEPNSIREDESELCSLVLPHIFSNVGSN